MALAEKDIVSSGIDLFGQVLTILFIVALIIIFIVVIIWIIKKFFYTIPIPDIVKVERDRTISSALLSCPATIYNHDMYLAGRGRTGQKYLGKMKGYTEEEVRLTIPTGKTEIITSEEGIESEKEIYEQIDMKQDVFLVDIHRLQNLALIGKFFSKLILVRLLEDEHSELVGDIKVYSSGIREEKGYYYTTERINKAINTITQDMKQRFERTMLYDQLQAEGLMASLVNETNVRLVHDLSRREGLIGRLRKSDIETEKG